MNAKDAIRELSEKLEPARREFALSLYRESFRLIDSQVMNSSSIFWKLPNHILLNLDRLLSADPLRLSAFFRLAHSRRHHIAQQLLGESLPEDQVGFANLLAQCYTPSPTDVRDHGLLERPEPLSPLNRRQLMRYIRESGKDFFKRENDNTDRNEPKRRVFRVPADPWYVEIAIELSDLLSQILIECDVRIGLGPLSLDRQLSLHSILGVGLLGCDFAEPGEEQAVATTLVGATRLLVDLLRGILAGLDPGVPIADIKRIEGEWISWFASKRTRH